MENPGINSPRFTIEFNDKWYSKLEFLSPPPFLVIEKPYFYSDIVDKQIYIGWNEDGRGRRIGIDKKGFESLARVYRENTNWYE